MKQRKETTQRNQLRHAVGRLNPSFMKNNKEKEQNEDNRNVAKIDDSGMSQIPM